MGVIYDLAAPTYEHQEIVGELCFALKKFVKEKKGKCKVNISPLDVQLCRDDKTIVQPDIVVICDKDIITSKNIYGAPDLVIEVLSPGSKKKDMTIKLCKYAEAGVREYWIVDSKKEVVIVYEFSREDENDAQIHLYTFDNQIPVGIWNGECVVDFAEIKEYLDS